MRLRLERLRPREDGYWSWVLAPGQTLLLGRNPDSDVHLPEQTVSRRHCEVAFNGCQVVVRDLGSRSGTFVNAALVREPSGLLRVGDTLMAGGVQLRLRGVPALRPEWLTWNEGAAARVLGQWRQDDDPSSLPVLGDALEEAGCDDLDLLTHCRQAGGHLPGCWLLDLLAERDLESGATWLA
jgi:hypothetical protein